jgi:hypothetical protein
LCFHGQAGQDDEQILRRLRDIRLVQGDLNPEFALPAMRLNPPKDPPRLGHGSAKLAGGGSYRRAPERQLLPAAAWQFRGWSEELFHASR